MGGLHGGASLMCFLLALTLPRVLSLQELDDSTFKDYVSKHERVLVYWTGESCAVCREFLPKLETVATSMKSSGFETKIVRVDATNEKCRSLAGEYGITGPMMHYFVDGVNRMKYSGRELPEDVEAFLTSKERPAVQELSKDKLPAFFKSEDVPAELALVAQVRRKSSQHNAFLKSLARIMDLLDDSDEIRFATVWLESKKAGPSLTLRRFHGGADHTDFEFTGPWNHVDITFWVGKNSFPPIGYQFTEKYMAPIRLDLDFEGAVIFCPEDLDEHADRMAKDKATDKVLSLLESFVVEYPKWKFTLCDRNSLTRQMQEKLMGTDMDVLGSAKAVAVVLLGKKRRYILDNHNEAMNGKSLGKFFHDAAAGVLNGVYKSEGHIPTYDGSVMVLTGRTFDKFVKDPKKDYFVAFTHSRCQHCRSLFPRWEAFAKKLAGKGWAGKGVVIAKMDMEHNECEEEISQYPSFILYPAVARAKKMKKKIAYLADRAQSYEDFPMDRWFDFVSGNAVNLEGEEEKQLEEDVAKEEAKKKWAGGKVETRKRKGGKKEL